MMNSRETPKSNELANKTSVQKGLRSSIPNRKLDTALAGSRLDGISKRREEDGKYRPIQRLDLQRWENEGGMIYDVPPVEIRHFEVKPGDTLTVTDVRCDPLTGHKTLVMSLDRLEP